MTTIWPELEPEPPRARAAGPAAARAAPAVAAADRRRPSRCPVTCWPIVRSTEATVPAIVEVSEASLRLVCAVESEDSAEVTDASSVSIVLVEALDASSLASLSSADGELGLGRVDVLGERGGVDGGQDLTGGDRLPGLPR